MNDNKKVKDNYLFVSILCIIAAIIVRILNPGWLWFFFIPLSPIHTCLFLISNSCLNKLKNTNPKAERLFKISCVTFLIFYILLPDVTDDGSYYMIFNLYKYPLIDSILTLSALISLVINIVVIFSGLTLKNVSTESDTLSENKYKKNYLALRNISIISLVYCIVCIILCFFYGTTFGIVLNAVSIVLMLINIIGSNKMKKYSLFSCAISILFFLYISAVINKTLAIIMLVYLIKVIINKNKYI